MAKAKQYYYLIDSLDANKGEMISRGLKAVEAISGVTIDLKQGIVGVTSTINPEAHIQMACDLAGTVVRTKLKKRSLY